MGCGASKSVSVIKAKPVRPPSGQAKPAGQEQQQAGVGTPKKLPPIKAGSSSSNAETAGTPAAPALTVEDEKAGKGGVAFSIAVDGGGSGGAGGSLSAQPNSEIDRILKKPLPPRLRHLEPLDSLPVMSPEQLAEKLRKAEEKRERMLEKRRHSKVTKKSKARRQLLKAQDFAGNAAAGGATGTAGSMDLSASSGAGGNLETLQQKQASAEQKRLAQLAAVQEKQRLREERARAARERARQMKQEMLESELQIEKDEAGDESDTDSWLGENEDKEGRSRGRQLKNAASAPPLGHQQSQRDSSGYSSRDASSANDRGVGGDLSAAGSRVQTGKTVSTVLEGELDNDFFD